MNELVLNIDRKFDLKTTSKSRIRTKTSFNNYSNEIQRLELRSWSSFLTHKFSNQTLTHLRKRKRDKRRGFVWRKKMKKWKIRTRGRRTKTDEDRLLRLELIESVWWKIFFCFVMFCSPVILQVAVQGHYRNLCLQYCCQNFEEFVNTHTT